MGPTEAGPAGSIAGHRLTRATRAGYSRHELWLPVRSFPPVAAAHALLSARRTVAGERLREYARAWERVRAAAAAAGAHAWLFRAASPPDPTPYLEFLEWPAAAGDVTAAPELSAALAELTAAFPGTSERWDEVPPLYFPQEGGSS